MSQTMEKARETICIRNCCLDQKKVCVGCGRSLPEILEWHHADHQRREEITGAAKNRLQQHETLIAAR